MSTHGFQSGFRSGLKTGPKNTASLFSARTKKPRSTPHRFRHTFARIILQRGVSVRDVADLLGNSEQMVRKHYAAWIPERQERLTKILRDAFRSEERSV